MIPNVRMISWLVDQLVAVCLSLFPKNGWKLHFHAPFRALAIHSAQHFLTHPRRLSENATVCLVEWLIAHLSRDPALFDVLQLNRFC